MAEEVDGVYCDVTVLAAGDCHTVEGSSSQGRRRCKRRQNVELGAATVADRTNLVGMPTQLCSLHSTSRQELALSRRLIRQRARGRARVVSRGVSCPAMREHHQCLAKSDTTTDTVIITITISRHRWAHTHKMTRRVAVEHMRTTGKSNGTMIQRKQHWHMLSCARQQRVAATLQPQESNHRAARPPRLSAP